MNALDTLLAKFTNDVKALFAAQEGEIRMQIMDAIAATVSGNAGGRQDVISRQMPLGMDIPVSKPINGGKQKEQNVQVIERLAEAMDGPVDNTRIREAVHRAYPGRFTSIQINTAWRKIYKRKGSPWKQTRPANNTIPAQFTLVRPSS